MKTYWREQHCPKCNGSATTQFVRSEYGSRGERIKRVCVQCGYVWHEKPLDAEDNDSSPADPGPVGDYREITDDD